MAKPYEIRDPIHGLVQFNDLEREIINSKPFQRLRRIKQLAWTDYVYPGAVHNRFEHSIGVMHVAGRMFDVLFNDVRSKEIAKSEFSIVDEELLRLRQMVRIAALAHDLGHGPFSHAAESLFPRINSENSKRVPHEEYSICFIKAEISEILSAHRTANELALRPDEISSFIHGVPVDRKINLLKSLISGSLDSDRMDYLLRDAYHCGVRYGQYDLERVINTIGICEDNEDEGEFQIGINRDGIHAAEGLLIARFMMFTQVYFHKTRVIYDFHIEQALKNMLENVGGVFPDARSEKGRKEFLGWDDWRVLGLLAMGKGGEHGEILRNRNHHRLVYETEEFVDGELQVQRADKKFSKIKNQITELGCVERLVTGSWYKQDLRTEILVRRSDGISAKATQLSNLSNVVKSLKAVNQKRLYVPEASRDSAEIKVKAALNLNGE